MSARSRLPPPDLDSVVEVFPEDGADETDALISASTPWLSISEYGKTRKSQLEHLLYEQMQDIAKLQKSFTQAYDIDAGVWKPPRLPADLPIEPYEHAREDGEVDESKQMLRDMEEVLVELARRSGEGVVPASMEGVESGVSFREIDAVYEKAYAQLRMEQFSQLQRMISRQLDLGRGLLPTLAASAPWKTIVWEGQFNHGKLPISPIQIIGRTTTPLDLPGQEITVTLSTDFAVVPSRRGNEANVRFVRQWCTDPHPKYILRIAPGATPQQHQELMRFLEVSKVGRKLYVAELPGEPRRQFVFVPFCFVKVPSGCHPRLRELVRDDATGCLAILVWRNNVPGGDREGDCWGFDPGVVVPPPPAALLQQPVPPSNASIPPFLGPHTTATTRRIPLTRKPTNDPPPPAPIGIPQPFTTPQPLASPLLDALYARPPLDQQPSYWTPAAVPPAPLADTPPPSPHTSPTPYQTTAWPPPQQQSAPWLPSTTTITPTTIFTSNTALTASPTSLRFSLPLEGIDQAALQALQSLLNAAGRVWDAGEGRGPPRDPRLPKGPEG